MKTGNALHFAILVPHPDLAASLRNQSRFLFAAGLRGAWSFPHAAPLARLKRPLDEAELRDLAAALREATLERGGAIALGGPELVSCPGFHSFFGPALDLAPPPLPSPATLHAFPALVIGIALAAPAEAPLPGRIRDLPPARPGFFRAAMVANLTIKPLDGAFPAAAVPPAEENYSFEWRMGKPRWLPSLRNPSSRRAGRDRA
ncbi:MAG: hypothetical protein LBU16_07300 [Treponema sp.]|nr:hypothetical protein [Treponema sp.]